MLKLENININFKRNIISDSHLIIYDDEITVITGESGTGKTSLLNILGLLDTNSNYDYYFDDKTISKEDIEDFHRCTISYVFQDYNLFESMSVLNNFKVMYNLCGEKFSKSRVEELMVLVDLPLNKLKQKAKSLSGGEKQRLAIALGLVKKPRLLLLDEPTANLDKENKEHIISLLNELKETGIMIVIASHHPEMYNADHIYSIQNKTVVEEKSSTHKKQSHRKTEKGMKFNVIKNAFMQISCHSIEYTIICILFVYSFYSVLSESVMAREALEFYNQSIQGFLDTDIFISNEEFVDSSNSTGMYSLSQKKISEDEFEKIKSLEHVENIYPFHVMSIDTTIIYGENGQMVDENDDIYTNITYNGKQYNMNKDFSLDNEAGERIFEQTVDYNEQISKCNIVDENVENGIFISQNIASALGIQELNHTKISFGLPIPIGYYIAEGEVFKDDGTVLTGIPIYPSVSIIKEVSYEIKGIYTKSLDEYAIIDCTNGDAIYIDSDEYTRLYENTISDKEVMKAVKAGFSDDQFPGTELIYSMMSSSCFVMIDDYEYMDQVKEEIEEINEYFYVKTKGVVVDEIDDIKSFVYKSAYFQPLMLFVIVDILVLVIYIFMLKKRVKEFCLMKVNGVEKADIYNLLELLIIQIVTIPIVMGIIKAVFYQDNQYDYINWEYGIDTFFIQLGLILLVELTCLIGNRIYLKKVDVIEELRSN